MRERERVWGAEASVRQRAIPTIRRPASINRILTHIQTAIGSARIHKGRSEDAARACQCGYPPDTDLDIGAQYHADPVAASVHVSAASDGAAAAALATGDGGRRGGGGGAGGGLVGLLRSEGVVGHGAALAPGPDNRCRGGEVFVSFLLTKTRSRRAETQECQNVVYTSAAYGRVLCSCHGGQQQPWQITIRQNMCPNYANP